METNPKREHPLHELASRWEDEIGNKPQQGNRRTPRTEGLVHIREILKLLFPRGIVE